MKFGSRDPAPPSTGFINRLKLAIQSEFQPSDLGKRRLVRAKLTGLTTICARGLMLLISLLSLPLASRYLGKERFGLWLTLVGMVNWFSLADFGLANSLINALSTADGKSDHARARAAVSSVAPLLIAIAVCLLAIFFSVTLFIDWAGVFNASTPQARIEAPIAIAVVMLCFALRMLSSAVACIYTAYQEGHLYQLWSALCGLFSVCGLAIAIWSQCGLPALIGSFVGGWLLGDALAAFYLFGWRRPELRPSWRYFDWATAKALLFNGAELWMAQVSAVVMFQTDLIIIARLFGASAVAGYGTSLRLFSIVGVAQAAFITPLWAAYSESLARQDFSWLERTFKRSLRFSLFWSVSASILIAFSAGWLFKALVTSDIQAESRLMAPMMATEIINSVARCFAMLLNGIGATRSQAVFGPVAGVLNVGLSWYLGKAMGLPGVAWATAVCLGLFTLLVLRNDAKRRLNGLRQAF
jgi:O-antigen/teichoic acid export membrane protein